MPDGNPGGDNPMFGGPSGIGRLFALSMGTEISWLLPAALIGLIAGVWFTAGTARAGRLRAHLLLWGGWLLVSGAVFSFMHGVIHPYYTVALAPAIAALIGISVRELWRGREFAGSRMVLAAMSATTGVWAFILLDRTPTWLPALRWIVLIGSIAVASVIAVGAHRLGRTTAAVAAAALLFGVGAPAAYTIDTVARSPAGPIPTSGPAGAAFGPGPWGPGPGGPPRGRHSRQQRTASIAQGRRNPLGRRISRVDEREQPGASDRRVGDGDRRVQGV